MTQRNKDQKSVHSGGPGSSHQGGNHGETHRSEGEVKPGAPTNGERSHVSGGGGERDSHHTHDPKPRARA
ncbi:MAG: hypothetical protein JWR10_2856 [Rubritepida sp.]|nr:hypothetical protein [Rubritepida sp.]